MRKTMYLRTTAKRFTGLLLALLMVFSVVPVFAAGEVQLSAEELVLYDIELNSGNPLRVEQERRRTGGIARESEMPRLEFLQEDTSEEFPTESHVPGLKQNQATLRHRGLIGFDGDYALAGDSGPVSVIVMFEDAPAGVQVAEASARGGNLSMSAAERIAEDNHALFRRELASLFPVAHGGSAPFSIDREYRRAINGVTMTLPSDMVSAIADFESVSAVFPNAMVWLNPPDVNAISSAVSAHSGDTPYGMAAGRSTMGADLLHGEGIRGAGVIVAVLDTGIDYNHPAFAGAFPSLATMQQRNPAITDADTIGGIFFGRNFYDDAAPNDPMETTLEMAGGDVWAATDHGTHVAGTIAARDTGGAVSALGVAPEAYVIAYRVLGPGGGGSFDVIIAGIEWMYYDNPDVVNMSLGADFNTPICPMTISVNNLMLARPNITFVLAAGNAGEYGFYTVGIPAPATKAITVGSVGISGFGTGDVPEIWLSEFSSMGPVNISFEIKPDVVAHGSDVFSVLPPWSPFSSEPGSPDITVPGLGTGYGYMSGTSMAAPHVAGAVALMVQAGRENGNTWTSEEIKTRLMNTAGELGGYSAFAEGAGYVNVYWAIGNDTVVFVDYHKVVTNPEAPFGENFASTRTGSFSFGGHLNSVANPQGITRTMTATIANQSGQTRTYSLDYRFDNNPNNAASIAFCSPTVTVPANSEAAFEVTMTVGENAVHSFYEGSIIVAHGSDEITLPFALVVQQETAPEVIWISTPLGFVGIEYLGELAIDLFGDLTRYEVISGELPPGLELYYFGEFFGVHWIDIIGMPTQAGIFNFTLLVENAAGYDTAELTIEIRTIEPPVIVSSTLRQGIVGIPYEEVILFDGQGAWADSVSIVEGSLPPGIETDFEQWRYIFGPHQYTWINLVGEPTLAGTFTFTIEVANPSGYARQEMTITINPVIDITDAFTDPAFREFLQSEIGPTIHNTDVANVRFMALDGMGIRNLDGIEHFINLHELSVVYNMLSVLDLPGNLPLQGLNVAGNYLRELDVSAFPMLQVLIASENMLSALDLSRNTVLWYVEAQSNNLVSLDVSNNPALELLYIAHNQLTSLDVSNSPWLWEIDASHNRLTSLNLLNNTELEWVFLWNNLLTSIDVSNSPWLWFLDVGSNNLYSLDVTNNPELKILWANHNQLTSLDVSNNILLDSLSVWTNQLTSLDVTNNTSLLFLDVAMNFMASPASVIGWEEIGLELGVDFIFAPQRTAVRVDGWHLIDGIWFFYIGGSRHMGWLQIGIDWFYFLPEQNGAVAIGAHQINGVWQYFHPNGAWSHYIDVDIEGWQLIDGTWFFYIAGIRVIGWHYMDGHWFYFLPEQNGAVAIGAHQINGVWQYFHPNGAWSHYIVVELDGWQLIYGIWFFYIEGTRVIGWHFMDGNWFYFLPEQNGAVAIGAHQINGVWQYFHPNGAWSHYIVVELDGWQLIGGIWFFYIEGTRVIGWHFMDGNWFYFLPEQNGAVAIGAHQINGVWQYFHPNGAWSHYIIDNSGIHGDVYDEAYDDASNDLSDDLQPEYAE